MTTVLTRYVNTANPVAGDGTTNATDGGTTSAFKTLSGALGSLGSAYPDLVAADVTIHIVCSGAAADTGSVNFTTAWVMDATHGIDVYGAYTSVWDNTKYRLRPSSARAISSSTIKYLRLHGVQLGLVNTGNTGLTMFGHNAVNGEWLLERCLVDGTAITSGATGASLLAATGAGCGLTVKNSVIYGVKTSGSRAVSQTGANCRVTLLNTTIHDCTTGVQQTSGTLTARNTGTTGCVTGWSLTGGTRHADCSNNASGDATAPGTGARHGVVATFVNAPAGDYHLAPEDDAWTGYGADLTALGVDADLVGVAVGGAWNIGADLPAAAVVVADRIAITTQPAVAVSVNDVVTVVAAARNAGGVTDATYATGIWRLRARVAPVGWDLATVLDSDTPAAGVAALTFAVPMAGAWAFGVDDDDDALSDSPNTAAVAATMPAPGGGGGTITLAPGALADMDLLKGGSGARRTLIYQATDAATGAPLTGLAGKPDISVNGAAPSTTPAAANAAHMGGGYYRVQIDDAAITAGDDVVVTAHGAARITSTVGRVTLTDVAPASATTDDTAAAVAAHADVQAIKAAATGVRADLTPVRVAKLDNLDAPISGVIAGDVDEGAIAAGVVSHPDIQAIKTAASGLRADLTTTRAGKLDNLDAPVSGVAAGEVDEAAIAAAVVGHADVQAIKAAAQGVRTDVTTARAAKLDNLDAAVSGIAAGDVDGGAIAAAVRAELAPELARLDADVSDAVIAATAANATAELARREAAQGGTVGTRTGATQVVTVKDQQGNTLGTRKITYPSSTSGAVSEIGALE